jgi:hypothetical protein
MSPWAQLQLLIGGGAVGAMGCKEAACTAVPTAALLCWLGVRLQWAARMLLRLRGIGSGPAGSAIAFPSNDSLQTQQLCKFRRSKTVHAQIGAKLAGVGTPAKCVKRCKRTA